jgi:hypothetical protein
VKSVLAASATAHPRSRGRSADEVAQRIGFPAEFVRLVLDDEVRRGHLERDEAGMYRASGDAVRRYGRAFELMWPNGEGQLA